MEGIIIIDKPEGFTSFDVVAKMRGILKTRKIGHAGTLDPMATGVLPLFVGRATKCCDILPCQDKRYQAVFQLGWTTDTLDRTGEVLGRFPVTVCRRDVEQTLKRFRGEILQTPPMYSAIQVNGQRLYDLARQGVEVERKARKITIYSLELLAADEAENSYTIDVACSKGTYIRSLCHDIGQALGCGATMTALRRTEAAGYSLKESVTLEEAQALAQQGTLEQKIFPIESVFSNLPSLRLKGPQEGLYRNGVRLDLSRLNLRDLDPKGAGWVSGQDIRILAEDGSFLGVSYPDLESGLLMSRKFFAVG